MEANLAYFIDVILNLNKHMGEIIAQYGIWVYLILFLVIFCETGLVVTPFLPGDSLLFVIGALAAGGEINMVTITTILIMAAIIGNMVNYQIGRAVGPIIFEAERVRFLKKEHLVKTHNFYEKHGGKAVVIARFMPIFRTFVPFVAGIARMDYTRFTIYNATSSAAWVLVFIMGGYLFGNIPVVEENFTLVIFIVIIISLMPGIITAWRERSRNKALIR